VPAERGRARRLFAFVAHVLPHLDRSGCVRSGGVSGGRVVCRVVSLVVSCRVVSCVPSGGLHYLSHDPVMSRSVPSTNWAQLTVLAWPLTPRHRCHPSRPSFRSHRVTHFGADGVGGPGTLSSQPQVQGLHQTAFPPTRPSTFAPDGHAVVGRVPPEDSNCHHICPSKVVSTGEDASLAHDRTHARTHTDIYWSWRAWGGEALLVYGETRHVCFHTEARSVLGPGELVRFARAPV
jgi:hypothetical protein